MTTHQCPIGLYEDGKGSKKYCALRHKKGNYILKDRMNAELPIIRNCDECYANILSPTPVYTIDRAEIQNIGAKYMRMEFTTESYDTALETAKEHISIAENKNMPRLKLENTTDRYFRRGVM